MLLPAGVATREVVQSVEVLHERLDPEVVWAGRARGPVPGHDPPMSFHADVALSDVEARPTVLLLPGGFGSLELARDDKVLAHLRRIAAEPTICFSISTGSLPLAAAGLIEGERATGHWLSMPHLEEFGAVPVYEPEVVSGRFFTASGAVAAVEVAHHVADRAWFGPQVDAYRSSIDLGQSP